MAISFETHSSSGSAIGLVRTLTKQYPNEIRIAPMETDITMMAAGVMGIFQNKIV